MSTEFAALTELVARRLWGEPNSKLSTSSELRFGSRGSKSVKISTGQWYDHETKEGGGYLDLIARETGRAGCDAIEWMKQQGLPMDDAPRANDYSHNVMGNGTARHACTKGKRARKRKLNIVKTYDYVDEVSNLLFQVCRLDPKDFRQRRPDPNKPGKWIWNLDGVRQVPYRLPELHEAIAAEMWIFVVEGEKDVDALVALGIHATCNPQGAGKWPVGFSEFFRDALVCIIPDNDKAGRVHCAKVGAALLGTAREVKALELPGLPEKGDFSDWAAANAGPDLDAKLWELFAQTARPFEAALGSEVEAEANVDWRQLLKLTPRGVPYANVANIAIELEADPIWDGIFYFDDFQQQLMLAKPVPMRVGKANSTGLPRAWRDSDSTTALRWFELGDYPTMNLVKVDLAIAQVAESRRRIHPVREYLDGLSWDGVERLDRWLETYCRATIKDELHERYVRAVGKKFLISGVARIYQPGCQVDHVLVMESSQGALKSSALRVLGGQWFSDCLPGDLHNKDAADHLRGIWIVELAELGQIRRSTVETVKSFITRRQEQFRAAYGRHKIVYPRQCIFSGTTNKEIYLPDETGNRRFWPVKVRTIDIEALRSDRDQLWAEAKHRYLDGEKWWLDDDRLIATATDEQAARYEADPWEEVVRKYLINKSQVTIGRVLADAIGITIERQRKVEQNRVTEILTNLGWVRGKRTEHERPWVRQVCHDAP